MNMGYPNVFMYSLLLSDPHYSGTNCLSRLDWGIFLATIGLTLLAGWYAVIQQRSRQGAPPSKQSADWTDYLLMGRKLTLPLFVATLVATWYGDILGVTQIAFQYGVYNFVT